MIEYAILETEINSGATLPEIARNLGVSYGQVRDYCSKYNLSTKNAAIRKRRCGRDTELMMLVPICSSLSEICRRLRRAHTGANTRIIKDAIERLGLDTSHFLNGGQKTAVNRAIRDDRGSRFRVYSKDEYINFEYIKRDFLKKVPLRCSRCGLGDLWLGDKLVLQIDHVNGNNQDNQEENLRLLCPNCHSQTETYGSKNKKVVQPTGIEPVTSAMSGQHSTNELRSRE